MTLLDLAKEYKEFINTEAPIEWYQFSLISLNRLVGGSGIKGGRIIQLLGNKSSGKTSLALDLIANAQKDNKPCAYIDFECTLDLDYATFLGVDVEGILEDGNPALTIVNPDTAENGFMLCEKLIDAGAKLIVIDSIAAPVSKSELDKDLNDNEKMASTAGLITRFLKRVIPKLRNSGALLVVINQNRANMSSMPNAKATKPFGASALQYLISVNIELVRTGNKEDFTIVQAFTEKNKQGGKERSKCDIIMQYGKGFDIAHDVVMLSLESGKIDKQKNTYYTTIDGVEYKAVGIEQAKEKMPIEKLRELLCNP